MHPLANISQEYNLYFGRKLIKTFNSIPSNEEIIEELSKLNLEKLEDEIFSFLVSLVKIGNCENCSRNDANDILEGHLCFHCPDKDVWSYQCNYCNTKYETFEQAKECALQCFQKKFPCLKAGKIIGGMLQQCEQTVLVKKPII